MISIVASMYTYIQIYAFVGLLSGNLYMTQFMALLILCATSLKSIQQIFFTTATIEGILFITYRVLKYAYIKQANVASIPKGILIANCQSLYHKKNHKMHIVQKISTKHRITRTTLLLIITATTLVEVLELWLVLLCIFLISFLFLQLLTITISSHCAHIRLYSCCFDILLCLLQLAQTDVRANIGR